MTTIQLAVDPTESLLTDRVAIRVSGAMPGGRITLRLSHDDNANVSWVSEALFFADARGSVDPAEAPSNGGSYTGIDNDGLWWSIRPQGITDFRTFQSTSKERMHNLGEPAGDPLQQRHYRLDVLAGDEIVASSAIVRHRVNSNVATDKLSEGRLRGMIFSQRDRTKSLGAILAVTGSGGGVDLGYPVLLASAGYDVLSIAHFNWPGRPATLDRIDLEYFAEAMEWMQRRFGHGRVAIQGGSRGGELALLLGATFPEHVAGVVSVVGISHLFPGRNDKEGWTVPAWTLGGQPLPFVKVGSNDEIDQTTTTSESEYGEVMAPAFEKALLQSGQESAAIGVENTHGPILLISGAKDALWPGSAGSDRVMDRLRICGFTYPKRHLKFFGVGHRIPLPSSGAMMVRSMYHPITRNFLDCGGDPEPSAAASRVMWQALLDHYETVFPPKI